MHDNFFAIDFDGVLANSLPIAIEEYRQIIVTEFPEVPIPYDQQDLAYLFPGPLRTSLRRFGLSDADSQRFFDLHSNAMRRRADEIELFEPVAEILSEIPIDNYAIVTSAYSDAVRSIIALSGHRELSQLVQILGRELSLRKSEKFRKIAQDNCIEIRNIVKVGDMVSDIIYARETGIAVWSVGWGYHPLSYLAAFDPDESIDSFSQLYDKMKGRCQ